MFKNINALSFSNIYTTQWSDAPEEVVKEVKDLWSYMSFGNDHYYYDTDIKSLRKLSNDTGISFENLIKDLKKRGLSEDEGVLIHWWW